MIPKFSHYPKPLNIIRRSARTATLEAMGDASIHAGSLGPATSLLGLLKPKFSHPVVAFFSLSLPLSNSGAEEQEVPTR
jgi:hypothetical protein